MTSIPRTLLSLMPLVASFALGCGSIAEPLDPQTQSLRGQFVLAEEPAEPLTIAESQEKIAEQPEVVVVGRIDASTFDPWAKGQAAFVISEAPKDGAGHADRPGHDAANCPFCKRRAAKQDATALIQLRDEQGEVLPIDARKLLGVKENQVVVVRGQGQVNDLGVLIISATGVHLRK